MSRRRAAAGAAVLGAVATLVLAPAAAANGSPARAAETVLRNGYVYTVDARESVREAVAIRRGRIVYVGSDRGVRRYIGRRTRVLNLRGRMAMPGLHDGHMHPLSGGANLLKCNLEYAPLTVAEFQGRIAACLRETVSEEPDGWLEVVGWYVQFMQPPGTAVTKETLDALDTRRPILVSSTDGHTALANSRALALAGVTAATPDPPDGVIERDASGNPTGVLQDGAQRLVASRLPAPTAADGVAAARAALDAMRRQGVTTFMDAWPEPPGATLAAFARIRRAGDLTARAHFAPEVRVDEADSPRKAIRRLNRLARRYGDRRVRVSPGLTVRNAKLFTDGVLQAPAQTAALLEPYLVNRGTAERPEWVPGTNRGQLYFRPAVLNALVRVLARGGWDPHIHAIGDRAVRVTLDAYRGMRRAVRRRDVRAALAHAELVAPADFGRFRRLNVIPVMSFQWAKPGPDSIDAARDYLGPERFSRLEPEGSLQRAGARIAFGSDWPVDPLDEWYALQVGVTRRSRLGAQYPKYAGRLNAERGLSRKAVIRAATFNAAYQLHQDRLTGSLERGKLADLIVLDRNLFRIPAGRIAGTRVLLTMVGGQVVYRSRRLR